MPFNILLLEDDPGQLAAYRQALEDDGLQGRYNLLHANNTEDANNLINNHEINAAILDLKVPTSASGDAVIMSGVEYLKSILSGKQFPVAVVSANITSLDDDDPSLPKHLIKMDKQTGVHGNVFSRFESIKELLAVTPLFPEAIQEIQTEFQQAFWKLWGHWEDVNVRFNPSDVENTKIFLKRYVCSYLIEKWMANDLFNKMHHTEFYTYPPVKDRIHTGDIIELDGIYWMVITAPCDLSNGDYPENLTLLKCELINFETYDEIVRPFREESTEKKRNEKIEKVRKFFTQQPPSKHYLPPWRGGGRPANVLFKEIMTTSFSEDRRENLKSKRVATLSYHFLPFLLQRYGSYVSRIGQSDINAEGYIHYLLSVVPVQASS